MKPITTGLALLAVLLLGATTETLAAPITFSFAGTASVDAPGDGWWNVAAPGGTINGTFTFDDSLFSGLGFFTVPGNSDRRFIEQEYPNASIAFSYTHVTDFYNTTLLGATAATYPVVQTTARPDLRFVDFSSSDSIGFVYDNMDNGTWAPFTNLYFWNIATLDDPQELVGAVGIARHKASYLQVNMGYEYDIQVTGIVGQPVPEPASLLLLGTGLVGMAGAARRRMKK